MNWRAVAWVVCGAALVSLSAGLYYYREKYLSAENQLTVLTAQAEARQTVLTNQQKDEAGQYEAKKTSDAAAIRSLRAELNRLRKQAGSVRANKASAASKGSGSTGGEPDLLGALLEGAELASEGAGIAREEHSALETCVRMYRQAETVSK